ncbi:hypothetical protein H5410_045840 [Solanum commersonii]|uniref:DUF1985 domain-containing protein n=1 Tax=Solanum commersonii TaxID=4109 RepID=A0A9J5XDX4_SOLCO|nr:hypothetical protein H5410_045840 [Solanum commersonii]
MLLELKQDNTKVLHIRHANESILNFGIKKFSLITSLKCKCNTKDFAYPESTPCRLFQKYFPDAVNSISKSRLVQRFLMGNWENNQDALHMAILYFVHTFILSQTGDSSISIDEFLMMYRLYGMSYALNEWTYECASQVNPEMVVKQRNVIPKICNWRVVAVNPKFGMLMSSIFTEKFVATNLHEDQHALASSPPTTSINPKVVQSKDIFVFGDFSTSPPKQLIRRSSRVSDTSYPPPPQRRKKVDASKTKVDKKFEKLESLIKENHSQLMQSLHKEDNQPLKAVMLLNSLMKDVVSKPMACTVEVSEQKGNVDPQSSTFQFDKQPPSPIHMDLADEFGVSTDEVSVSVNEVEHQVHVTSEHVSELHPIDENTHVDTEANEPKKDDEADQTPQDINEVTINEDGDDTVQHNIHQFVSDTIKDSSISTTISPSTQAAIDALISDLGKGPIPAKSLCAINQQDLTDSHAWLSNSQLPTDIPFTEIVVRSDSKTYVPRNKMPSKLLQSLYLTYFRSSEKGKEKLDDDVRLYFPFEGCGITYQAPSNLIDEYKQWVTKGLLKTHANKKKVHSSEIKKLSRMLPTYLLDNRFYEKIERTNWGDCDAYKDKEIGSLLEPQHPFMVEFAQDIMQQKNCGLYVTTFAEFLSDQHEIPLHGFLSEYLRNGYGALLWSYGSEKAKVGYVSENDDPLKPKGLVTPPPEKDLVHIE